MSNKFNYSKWQKRADSLAHWGLILIIYITLINLPLSMIAAYSGSWRLLRWQEGGGWAIPALTFMIALLLGLPSLVLGLIDLKREGWQQAGQVLAFLGPLIIFVGFIFISHDLDPCHLGVWTVQSRFGSIPLCERYLGEVLIDTRFHWLLHAIPDPFLVSAYWFALRKWHQDIAFMHAHELEIEKEGE
jgi:hypothetical protein